MTILISCFGESSHYISEGPPFIIIQSIQGAMDSVAGLFLSTISADDNKMTKNQYYQIPHPAPEIIRESDTNTKDNIKCSIIQASG